MKDIGVKAQYQDIINLYMQSKDDSVNLRKLAHARLQAKFRRATIKDADIEKEIQVILEEQKITLEEVQEQDEGEDEEEEEEAPTLKAGQQPRTAPAAKPVEEEKKADEEEEEEDDEEKTIKPGQRPPPPRPSVAKFEAPVEDDDDSEVEEETLKPGQAPKQRKEIIPVPTLTSSTQLVLTKKDLAKVKEVTSRKAIESINLPIREASSISQLSAPKDVNKDHSLILYKDCKIIHSQIFKEYSLEPEYRNNPDLLIKRACQKQTVIFIEEDKFEAQDTNEKVEKFLKQYSRYFKDVIKIDKLAQGGESIVYTLQHSLPDELVIKCPLLTEEDQVKNLATAFNGILYESQIINLNLNQGHVVNNVEEIILYNKKKKVITNYCVIVEKALYSFESLIKIWTDKTKSYIAQDFYTPEKVTFYFLQTLMAINYFHKRNIYYGDMKGPNLLIFRNQEIKIGDLGVSIKMQPPGLKKKVKKSTFFDELAIDEDPELKELEEELMALNAEYQDANANQEDGDFAVDDGIMEKPKYKLKGLTGGYVLPHVSDAYYKAQSLARKDLIANDRYALEVTFEKIILSLKKVPGYVFNREDDFVRIFSDVKNTKDYKLSDVMKKWALKIEKDYSFKNRLCDQLKKEYKFLGLPKVHLFLHQNIIVNFYMKKQIVYQKDIEEIKAQDVPEEPFDALTYDTDKYDEIVDEDHIEEKKDERKEFTREEEQFPYELKSMTDEQKQIERIDFYWACRAAKITIDTIQKDLDKVMMEQLLIRTKEKDEQMYDFKEFKIKEIIKKPDLCLNAVKMIDAILGPNHEGKQVELQYKLCHDISKALVDEYTELAKKQSEEQAQVSFLKAEEARKLTTRFLRRLEQFFVLEYQEEKETGFKEQQIRKLEQQIEANYQKCFTLDPKTNKLVPILEKRHEIQFAFYSYFMYKYNRKKMGKRNSPTYKTDLVKQIQYIEDSLPIFKNLMGENVALQNTLFYKQADSMMKGEFYSEVEEEGEKKEILTKKMDHGANANYKRLYLTKKSLESFHDYVYSLRLKLVQELKKSHNYKTTEELLDNKESLNFLINQIEDVYNDERMQSGFLLFKEFFNRYYGFVPGYGLKNPKITDRFKYLDESDITDIIPERIPRFFTYQFQKFLKQINDNSTEDISKKRVHLYSYDEMQPKNTYLNLNYKCLNLESIDLSESILSDDIELLLQYQQHKVILKKIIINFDVNQKIIAIDCEYWDSNLQITIKTDHYKEFKQSEIVFEFPRGVYPISMQIIVGRRLTMRLSNFEYYQIDSDYPDTHYVEKENRMTLYTKLFKPFCEVIMGNFQFYNPLAQELRSQAYYLKISRQHHMFNLVRSLIHKHLQIVQDYSQIKEDHTKLIVYKDKYLLTYEMFKKLENELRSEGQSEQSFAWLFSQEKLLNQRRTSWKQYFKDVRNHLIYYWKNLQIQEAFKKNNTPEDIKKGVKAATQEAQILHTIDSLETAVQTMTEHLNNRYIYKNNELDWTIQIGYKVGGNSSQLTDFSQMSTLEKQVYTYQLIVMLMIIYEKGFTVESITKIEYGQEVFIVDVKYNDINCIQEVFTVTEFIPLLGKYFKDSLKEVEGDLYPEIKKFDEIEDLLSEWRDQFQSNFRSNLAEIIKKDKLLSQFMRVLPLPPSRIFQSELLLFEKEKRVLRKEYSEDDQVLIELMLLRASHRSKTPSNTIRNTKYQQKLFTAERIKRIFNNLQEQSQADPQWLKLFQFYKEQVFRYHAYDTNPKLLDQWRTEIGALYDQRDLVQYANYFFYSTYDYYSMKFEDLRLQLSDMLSIVTREIARETIKTIFQIVLARIQGSLKENRGPYLQFLKQYYDDGDEAYVEIVKKVDEYIDQEYDDPDYKGYEAEFSEFNDCTEAIKKLKDQRPWNDGKVKYPKELDEVLLQEFRKQVSKQFDNQVRESQVAKELYDKILRFERKQPDLKKIEKQYPEWSNLRYELALHQQKPVGNLLMKKLILKASRTKHRVFNQYRIAKKFLKPYEEHINTLPNKQEYLPALYNLLNKTYEVTLVEQIDHQYLPKYREIFNRLDEQHRFTNFDEFEVVALEAQKFIIWTQSLSPEELKKQTAQLSRATTKALFLESQQNSLTRSIKKAMSNKVKEVQNEEAIKESQDDDTKKDVLANKYIDLSFWPSIVSIDFYVSEDLTLHDVVASYRFVNAPSYQHEIFKGRQLNDGEHAHLKKITLELLMSETLVEVTSTGGKTKITDLILITKDGGERAKHYYDASKDWQKEADEVDLDSEALNSNKTLISFSGLTSAHGLINLNQYYFHFTEEQDPEEEHVYFECDSDDEDYFNPGEEQAPVAQ